MTETKSNRRLPQGDWVLVTGANGYIASHVVDILLEEGYNVRGTVRSAKPWLDKYFTDKHGQGRFESSVLGGMEDESVFDEAVKGVSGIVHVASDLTFNPDPNAVVPKVVAGTVNVLKAAAREDSVKSVVLTSSSSATLLPEVNKEGIVVDENTWNDRVLDAVYREDTPKAGLPYMVYAASKTAGEREFWKWVELNHPRFAVNAVLPNTNLGKILMPEQPGSTMGLVKAVLNGNEQMMQLLPPQWFVDVRDTARLHVAALLDPQIENERLFAYATTFNWTDILNSFAKLRPDNKKTVKPPTNEGRDLSEIKPRKRAEEVIQSFFGVPGWTSLEDSIAAGIEESVA